MGVKLQSSLGGSVEINAPSTASSYTITAPAGNGTMDYLQRSGNVLQVVDYWDVNQYVTNSTSYVFVSGVSITPSLLNSKILVIASTIIGRNSANGNTFVNIGKNGGTLRPLGIDCQAGYWLDYAPAAGVGNTTIHIFDNPTSLTPQMYQIGFYTTEPSGVSYIGNRGGGSYKSGIHWTLMEIAG